MNKEEINKLNEAIEHCEDVISNLKLKENCDECLKQHEQLKEWLEDYKFIKEKIEWLKEEMTEQAFNLVFSTQEFLHSWYKGIQIISAENAILQKKLSDYENPQPYKFEELKEGIWIWDDVEKCCFKCNPTISTDMAQCVTYNAFWYNCGEDEDEFFEEYDEFEEGRFFPVTKALEYQRKEDEND